MLLLISYYKIYLKDGIKPTKKVLKITMAEKEDTDIYNLFLNETIKEAPLGNKILRSMLYQLFTHWIRENNYDKKISSKVFAKELPKRINVEKSLVNTTQQFCINGYTLIKDSNDLD